MIEWFFQRFLEFIFSSIRGFDVPDARFCPVNGAFEVHRCDRKIDGIASGIDPSDDADDLAHHADRSHAGRWFYADGDMLAIDMQGIDDFGIANQLVVLAAIGLKIPAAAFERRVVHCAGKGKGLSEGDKG